MARRLLSITAAAMSVLMFAHEADAFYDVKRTTGPHAEFLEKSPRAGNTESKRGLLVASSSPVQEAFYEQAVLDHNAPVSQQKFWKQRYLVNQRYWGGKGFPVFFFNGGEAELHSGWIDIGSNMGQLAVKHKALLVGLEHRYYGQSVPTPDLSVENLRFLTSEQQLADVARFHGFLTKTMGLETSKWIAFGGSYGGSLAAWVKLKYPSLFAGAVSSSGPLQAKSNFFEYNEVVGRSLRYFGGDACYNRIEQGIVDFRKLVDGGNATKSQLQTLFPLCHPIKNDVDLSIVEDGIITPIQGAVQSSNSRTSAKDMCAYFANATQTPLELLSRFTIDNLAGPCLDSTFEGNADGLVEFLRNTTVDREKSSRQWFYQTCNEFGWYQTTTSPNQPFYALKSMTEAALGLEKCKRVFNIDVAPGVARTNAVYGGLNLTVDNVTFVSGSIDPWSAMSVTNETHLNSATASAVYIVGTMHMADSNAPSRNDIPALTAAFAKIAANVATYLGA